MKTLIYEEENEMNRNALLLYLIHLRDLEIAKKE